MFKYKNEYPKYYEIQTASYCNAGCLICPYRDVHKSLSSGVMPMLLFKKIIKQVPNKWGYRIILYFNNEPFLDPLFFDRLKLIQKFCSNVELEISTNLSLLNTTKQEQLSDYLIDDLRLSVFGFSTHSHKKIMPGLNWDRVKENLNILAKNKKLRKNIGKLSLVMINYPGISKEDIKKAAKFCESHYMKFELWGFLDRSQNVNALSNNINHKNIIGCEQNRPLDRMHITFNGKVVLCCMDWKWQYILGDLNESHLKDIWQSDIYDKIRQDIYYKNRQAPEICQKCKLALTN